MSKKLSYALGAMLLLFCTFITSAANYTIDPAHSFVNFKVYHLGYSWLHGRFNDISGTFSFDRANLTKSTINMKIATSSLDSNHAKRDKHLRSNDFISVNKFPFATFKSTRFVLDKKGKLKQVIGDLTFYGKTREISVNIKHIGGGSDPWGGHRHGFSGGFTFTPGDFGLDLKSKLGPASEKVIVTIGVEGVKQ